ncbi:hypothetical protein OG760_21005 [Streptomyces sp. NBC_00963]|uniref:hypothetical protein n=1 Tax=Streptomyces sp. NBC_00963 TaxID=2903697 RepID=UPI00386657ED|nr:hypothetical protein OG760_21005 [Streptomyces sp. NBC_00963]
MTTSTTTLPPIPSNGDIPPLSFTVPEGFFTLPLAATFEERTALADTFVRELYSRGDEKIWEPAVPYYAAIAEYMAENGLSYSAMGLFSTEEEGVAQCAFTVAAVETDQADPDIAAQGILAILNKDPFNDARWLELPCGPAVTCVTLREIVLSPEVTASGEETKLMTGQIQVHIPFRTGPYTAVFTLDTASIEYWDEFCDMTMAILQTVSFASPENSTQWEASADPSESRP